MRQVVADRRHNGAHCHVLTLTPRQPPRPERPGNWLVVVSRRGGRYVLAEAETVREARAVLARCRGVEGRVRVERYNLRASGG